MPSSLLEIVELANGEFVLRNASGEDAPLVNIRFSQKTKDFIAGAELDIAKVMIQAGIQAVAYLHEEQMQSSEDTEEPVKHHLLH